MAWFQQILLLALLIPLVNLREARAGGSPQESPDNSIIVAGVAHAWPDPPADIVKELRPGVTMVTGVRVHIASVIAGPENLLDIWVRCAPPDGTDIPLRVPIPGKTYVFWLAPDTKPLGYRLAHEKDWCLLPVEFLPAREDLSSAHLPLERLRRIGHLNLRSKVSQIALEWMRMAASCYIEKEDKEFFFNLARDATVPLQLRGIAVETLCLRSPHAPGIYDVGISVLRESSGFGREILDENGNEQVVNKSGIAAGLRGVLGDAGFTDKVQLSWLRSGVPELANIALAEVRSQGNTRLGREVTNLLVRYEQDVQWLRGSQCLCVRTLDRLSGREPRGDGAFLADPKAAIGTWQVFDWTKTADKPLSLPASRTIVLPTTTIPQVKTP